MIDKTESSYMTCKRYGINVGTGVLADDVAKVLRQLEQTIYERDKLISKMDNEKDEINDPLFNAIYNQGLEWAATWLETYIPGATPEIAEFARCMAMSIRTARRPVDFQQTWADAVRNDPYMTAEHKEYWLSLASDVADVPASVEGGDTTHQ